MSEFSQPPLEILTPEMLLQIGDVSVAAAIGAAEVVMPFWPSLLNYDFDPRRQNDVAYKAGIGNIQMTADKLSEAFIIKTIQAVRPNDRILSEELEESIAGSSRVVWINDPIDGTVNFANGSPDFGLSVGATYNGEAVSGVIAVPAKGYMISALKGQGVHVLDMKGNKIVPHLENRSLPDVSQLSDEELLKKTIVAFDVSYQDRQPQVESIARIADHIWFPKSFTSSSISNVEIALGTIGAFIATAPTINDLGAAAAIITELSGAASDKNGYPLDWDAPAGSHTYIAARTPRIHSALIDLLKRTAA